MKLRIRMGFAVAALVLPLAACSSPESQVESGIAELEKQEPVYALLREHEPSAYAEMRALVEQTMRDGGRPNQPEMIRRSREIFTQAIGRRVATAPDDVIQQMTTFIADQTQALEKNPDVCRDLLAGRAGDIRPFIPVNLQQRERALYETLLETPGRPDQPVATQEQLQKAFGPMLKDARGALGLSESAITNALNGAGPPAEVCRANGYLMRRISQLPANEGAPVFRLITRLANQARQGSSPVGSPK